MEVGGRGTGNGFVPTGCLTLIALGGVFVVCIFFLVFNVLKSSNAYKMSLEHAKKLERVTAALGTPVRLVPSGKTSVSGPSGETDFAIPISGPKGKAAIYVVGTKSASQWEFSKLIVQTESGETINLNEATESASTSDEGAEEETADERVQSAISQRHLDLS